MKIKKTHIYFFSCPWDLSLQSYCPFHFLNYKPMEACEQNITTTTCLDQEVSTDGDCTLPLQRFHVSHPTPFNYTSTIIN